VAEHAHEQMVIRADSRRCFEVVVDFERYPEWAADIKEVEVLRRDEEGRPLTVHFRAGAFGRSATYTLEYDYSRAPEVLSWKQTAGDATSRLDGSYSFRPVGDAETEVTYDLYVELAVPMPGFVKRRAEDRITHIALRELKARIEGNRP
jgi:ribosome-associated toxin RatA of RatAB toxin-antitoxin module